MRTDCEKEEPLERQSGQKPVLSSNRPSLMKGEDSKRNTDFLAGEIPESEKPKTLFTLTGKAGGLETKTLRGLKP
jgi:hypothetical protein